MSKMGRKKLLISSPSRSSDPFETAPNPAADSAFFAQEQQRWRENEMAAQKALGSDVLLDAKWEGESAPLPAEEKNSGTVQVPLNRMRRYVCVCLLGLSMYLSYLFGVLFLLFIMMLSVTIATLSII